MSSPERRPYSNLVGFRAVLGFGVKFALNERDAVGLPGQQSFLCFNFERYPMRCFEFNLKFRCVNA